MARLTEQQKREKALMIAIARSTTELELYHDKDIAEFLGISAQSYHKYKKKKFQTSGLLLFAKMARHLHFTGREVCAAIGVPYEDRDNG